MNKRAKQSLVRQEKKRRKIKETKKISHRK